jgi:hypothetical protein
MSRCPLQQAPQLSHSNFGIASAYSIPDRAQVGGRGSKRNQHGDSRLAHRSPTRLILRLPQGMMAH